MLKEVKMEKAVKRVKITNRRINGSKERKNKVGKFVGTPPGLILNLRVVEKIRLDKTLEGARSDRALFRLVSGDGRANVESELSSAGL